MPVTKTELKKIKSLLTKKGRKQHQMFLAEGIRLLEESIRFRFLPHTVYYAPAVLSNRGEKLVKAFEAQRVQVISLSKRELSSLSDTETPQGMIGLFVIPSGKLRELYLPRHRMLLLCENISEPGNLGALARSALAFGFDLVLLTGSSAEPYSPKVVRASAGTVFGLRMAEVTLKEVDALMARERVTFIAADPAANTHARLPIKKVTGKKILLAIGSEASGLSKPLLARSDIRLRIRHSRAVESLNAAVAGSILMKEIYEITH